MHELPEGAVRLNMFVKMYGVKAGLEAKVCAYTANERPCESNINVWFELKLRSLDFKTEL
jgi:hypothetical protein